MRKARILLVEDEPALLKTNKSYFEEQGYEVMAAAQLSEAQAFLNEALPDLILLDVMLPDGSGFDFCREAKEITAAPVIFLTALGDMKDEEQGFALGGDDYFVKPYDLNRLGMRVAAILRRSGVQTNGRVELPPISVDLTSGLCVSDGKNINLSQMELRLLHYFIINHSKRVHRDTVYEEVWGAPAIDGTQTVIEHVYRLRKKLNMADPDSYFKITSNGKFYMFSKVRY